jgi:hypothetical protein
MNRLAEEIKTQLASIVDDEIADIVGAMDEAQKQHNGPGRFNYRFGIGVSLEPLERSIITECKATWSTKRKVERSGEVRLEPDMLDGLSQ